MWFGDCTLHSTLTHTTRSHQLHDQSSFVLQKVAVLWMDCTTRMLIPCAVSGRGSHLVTDPAAVGKRQGRVAP